MGFKEGLRCFCSVFLKWPTYSFYEHACVSICFVITCLFWYSLLSTLTLFNKLNLCSAAAFTREIMLLIDFIHTSLNKFKSHIIYLLQYQCIWVCVCVKTCHYGYASGGFSLSSNLYIVALLVFLQNICQEDPVCRVVDASTGGTGC